MYEVGPELQNEGIDAESFEKLADKALLHLRGERDLGMVCGPITTGGTGNQLHNFQVFNATLRGIEQFGVKLFNQIPYEFGLRRLAHKWEAEGNVGYCMPILTVFYARVFESGAISKGYFIPGWNSSFGARWEREKLIERGCAVHDLYHLNIRQFLDAEHPRDHVERIMSQLPK